MSDPQAEAYCRARLAGQDDVEAARTAGYAAGTSSAARELWHVTQMMIDPSSRPELDDLLKEHDRLARCEAVVKVSLRKTRGGLRHLKMKKRAIRLLEKIDFRGDDEEE